ncbi:carbohydrate ABC transporter permease [Enterococcus sp. LJL120]
MKKNKKRRRNNEQSDKSAYLFLFPAALIYLSVIIVPTIYSLYISLFKWNGFGKKTFIGLSNYFTLFTEDPVFIKSLINNIIWIVLTLVFIVSISFSLALLLNKEFKGRTFFRGLFYFPSVLSGILVAIVWGWIYNPNFGFLNEFLDKIGLSFLKLDWISDPKIALYAVFAAACWQGVGQPFILFLAGLQTVPVETLEAADIDGTSKLRKLISITIPQMKDTFIMVFATLIVAAMKVYDIVYGLTGGGPDNSTQTLATYMYSQTFMYNNVGKGTAIAILMLLMMMIVIIPYVSFTTRDD